MVRSCSIEFLLRTQKERAEATDTGSSHRGADPAGDRREPGLRDQANHGGIEISAQNCRKSQKGPEDHPDQRLAGSQKAAREAPSGTGAALSGGETQ